MKPSCTAIVCIVAIAAAAHGGAPLSFEINFAEEAYVDGENTEIVVVVKNTGDSTSWVSKPLVTYSVVVSLVQIEGEGEYPDRPYVPYELPEGFYFAHDVPRPLPIILSAGEGYTETYPLARLRPRWGEIVNPPQKT